MSTFKSILVGIDFSEAAKAALKEADRIAMWEDGELHALHVIPFNEAEDLIQYPAPRDEVFSVAHKELKRICEKTSDLCSKKEYHISVGHPFYQTMQWIDTVDADLLVIGSHGKSGTEGKVGPITVKCINYSPVPVLVVRRQHGEPFKVVVACTDFSQNATDAAQYAAEIADNEGAVLHLLNVQHDPYSIYTFPVYHDESSRVRKYLDESKKQAEKKISEHKKRLLKKHSNLKISTTVIPAVANVTQAIGDFLNKNKADLVVVGTQGHSKTYKYFIGTTAERLIHRSQCSVLTVNPKNKGDRF